MIWQSDILLGKYWVTQSGYFRLAATVKMVIVIIDVKLRFFNGVSDQSKYKIISMIEYNNSTVYDCFNIQFSVDSVTPYLNFPPVTIYDSPRKNKIARHTYDLLTPAVYVTSGKSVSTLTIPSNSPERFEANSDDHDAYHTHPETLLT